MSKHFRVARRLFPTLEESGVPVSAVLRRAGLPAALAQEARVLLGTEELFALWTAIGEVSEDQAIGLRLGSETRTEHFSPSALVALSTDDFGAAVEKVSRYKQLTCPEEVLQQNEDGEWRIRFRWTLATRPEPRVLTDVCFAWMLALARHGTGTQLSPLRVEYSEPRSYTRALERHFDCEIRSGAPLNAIVFRKEDAARPFVTRNAELLAMLAPQLEAELRQADDGEDSFAEHVRRAIQQQLTGRRPTIEDVSRALHMSSRTLQRRLQDSGSSFQRVLEEARRQLARHYLNNALLELTEAAYLLGYEDSNSFVRAFRTWEGVPPARWREQQRARAAS